MKQIIYALIVLSIQALICKSYADICIHTTPQTIYFEPHVFGQTVSFGNVVCSSNGRFYITSGSRGVLDDFVCWLEFHYESDICPDPFDMSSYPDGDYYFLTTVADPRFPLSGVSVAYVGQVTKMSDTIVNSPFQWRESCDSELQRPTYAQCPTRLPEKAGLVVVTHGRNPDTMWVTNMTNAITSYLVNNDLEAWQTHAHYWIEEATGDIFDLNLDTPLIHAANEGYNLGKHLSEQGWEKVHFIAHSAGAALIESAALTLAIKSPNTVVHETFLDPYMGRQYGGREYYGRNAHWADHYFSHDWRTGSYTEGSIPNAYNVNITFLDDNIQEGARILIGPDFYPIPKCDSLYSTHSWPYEFYLKTITNSVWASNEAEGLGFPVSMEGGNWNFAIGNLEISNFPARLLGHSICIPNVADNALPSKLVLEPNFTTLRLIEKNPGSVGVFSRGIQLTIPQSLSMGEAVNSMGDNHNYTWVAIPMYVSNLVNLISMDMLFSASNTNALCSVFWDTKLLATIDSAIQPTIGQHSYTFLLREDASIMHHMLVFRLDSYSGVPASISITNIALGRVGFEEPVKLTITTDSTVNLPIINFRASTNYTYVLQSSLDTKTWSPIASIYVTNTNTQFINLSASNSVSMFYQLLGP